MHIATAAALAALLLDTEGYYKPVNKFLAALLSTTCLLIAGCGPSAITLVSGLGNVHHRIATSSPAAQQFFDQGLAYFYGFNFDEAERSFHRAAELDPKAAMPYWGMALALGPNYNAASVSSDRAAAAANYCAKAVSMSVNSGERELAEALALRFFAPERGGGNEYAKAMARLYKANPDDPDLTALYAESMMDLRPYHLWGADGAPAAGTAVIVQVIEAGLRRWPNHVGLIHFYAHAMEQSPTPEKALGPAMRLESLAPASGHLLHMAGHVAFASGNYAAAVLAFRRAATADRSYLSRRSIPNTPYEIGYADHNLLFLADAAGMDGDFEAANAAAQELRRNALPAQEGFRSAVIFTLVRFSRWRDVLSLPEPRLQSHGVIFFWHFARGSALAALGQPARAAIEQSAMEAVYRQIPYGLSFGLPAAPLRTLHRIASASLAARIARAGGDSGQEIQDWQAAVAAEDAIGFREPPAWYPVRESLGDVLLRTRRYAMAEETFGADLTHNRGNPRSLIGLARSLVGQGRITEAGPLLTQYRAAWHSTGNPQ